MTYASVRPGGLVFPEFVFVFVFAFVFAFVCGFVFAFVCRFVFVFVFVLVVVHIYVAYASVRPGGLVFPGFLGEDSSCAIPVYQHRTHLNVI